jgi:hypothetical protein
MVIVTTSASREDQVDYAGGVLRRTAPPTTVTGHVGALSEQNPCTAELMAVAEALELVARDAKGDPGSWYASVALTSTN